MIRKMIIILGVCCFFRYTKASRGTCGRGMTDKPFRPFLSDEKEPLWGHTGNNGRSRSPDPQKTISRNQDPRAVVFLNEENHKGLRKIFPRGATVHLYGVNHMDVKNPLRDFENDIRNAPGWIMEATVGDLFHGKSKSWEGTISYVSLHIKDSSVDHRYRSGRTMKCRIRVHANGTIYLVGRRHGNGQSTSRKYLVHTEGGHKQSTNYGFKRAYWYTPLTEGAVLQRRVHGHPDRFHGDYYDEELIEAAMGTQRTLPLSRPNSKGPGGVRADELMFTNGDRICLRE